MTFIRTFAPFVFGTVDDYASQKLFNYTSDKNCYIEHLKIKHNLFVLILQV